MLRSAKDGEILQNEKLILKLDIWGMQGGKMEKTYPGMTLRSYIRENVMKEKFSSLIILGFLSY